MFETLRTAVRSLLSNKIRSALTMLGIIIGVGAVITMVAIGAGASKNIAQYISGVGSNILIVMPGASSAGGVRQQIGSSSALTVEDADALKREAFDLRGVAPEVYSRAQIIYGNLNWSTTVTGSTSDIFDIREWTVAAGRFFLDGENKSGAKVAVIGDTLARNLFGGEDPVGKTVRIRNVPVEVIGVLAPKGQTPWGQDQDDVIIAPYTTVQKRILAQNYIQSIQMSARSAEESDLAQSQVEEVLRRTHKLRENEDNDFEVRSQEELATTMTSVTEILTILLGAIAGISLLVGGIGIMNIMYVSVTERTREIGLRMSVGGRSVDILLQFLIESILLSVFGGLIGIVLGFAASSIVKALTSWPISVMWGSVILAFAVCTVIGVFFGWYPARRASELDPIDALRFE